MLFIRIGFDGRPYGGTVTFGAAAGKNDLLRLRSNQFGDIVSGRLNFAGNFSAKGMHAGRVAVVGTEIG